MNLSIACFRFKRGGGSESYMLDLINAFYERNIVPKVYSTHFDTSLTEYQKIEAKLAKLFFIPKKFRLPFLSNYILHKLTKDEIVISITHTYSDIIICGGQHKGYLKALNKKPNLLSKFQIWNEQKSFNVAKRIIAHSELMKEELISLYGIAEEKIKVIYPPANTHLFKTITDEHRLHLREKFGFNTNDIIYLFPSTGHRRKGFYWLKKFFEKTTLPIKLVVAGAPVKESKNIISLGFIKDMAELYQAADYTIMASSYEPFGLVGIESILSGTPVVFAQNIACVKTFQNDFGFTFNLNQPEKFEAVIQQSLMRVKNGNGRIHNPKNALNYDPDISHHIDLLLTEARTL